MSVLTDVGERVTHEAKWFVFRALLHLIDAFDCFLVKYIATNSVHGIGWITDHTTAAKDLRRLLNQACLWVVRVNRNDFSHGSGLFEWSSD